MTTPPPYTNISGISRTVMKDSPDTILNYNGNARPGELVVDLEVDPPLVYVGNNQGALSQIGSGGAGGNITVNTITGNTGPFNPGSQQWVGNSSGDGFGYTTLELIPDNTLVGTDQYVVLDPTVPTHIHIRAGGTPGSSQAELYLGSEDTYFRVVDSNGVTMNHSYVDSDTYSFNSGEAFINGSWYENSGEYFISFTSSDPEMVNVMNQVSSGNLVVSDGITDYPVTYGGLYNGMGAPNFFFQVEQAPPSNPTALTNMTLTLFPEFNSRVEIFQDSISIYADGSVSVTADGGEVSISSVGRFYSFTGVGTIVQPPVTYSTIANAATGGGRAIIVDANLAPSGNFGAQVSGGGANVTPVWSDGTNWYIG